MPAESAFFYIGTKVEMDLQSVIPVVQINTYSRHGGNRTPQGYAVYA